MEEQVLQELQGATAVATRTYAIRLLTPAAVHGAERKANFRIPSLRGVLRYWWRVCCPIQELSELKSRENDYFGGIDKNSGRKSPVRFRWPPQQVRGEYSELLPHRRKYGKQGMKKHALLAESEVHITMEIQKSFAKNSSSALTEIERSMELFLMLGSMGQRARRGFGALQWNQHDFKDVDEYIRHLKGLLDTEERKAEVKDTCNLQLTYEAAPNKYKRPLLVAVWIGEGSDSAAEVTERYGDASHKRGDTTSLGGIKPRFASPLWGTVRQIGGRYYPIISELDSHVRDEQHQKRYSQERDKFLAQMGVSGIGSD